MNNLQLIHGDNDSFEYYTPAYIMEPVRLVLGSIDHDPASCAAASELVQATSYTSKPGYTSQMIDGQEWRHYHLGGLAGHWIANTVFLNHPFSRGEKRCYDGCTKRKCTERGYHQFGDSPSSYHWIGKLVTEYQLGHIQSAITISFANTDTKWFSLLLPYPQVYLYKRVNFMTLKNGKLVEAKGVSKGAVLTFFGLDCAAIYDAFWRLGELKISYVSPSI